MVWVEKDKGKYYIETTYNTLQNLNIGQEVEEFKTITKFESITLTLYFSWKLLLDKVPTKENLEKMSLGITNRMWSLC